MGPFTKDLVHAENIVKGNLGPLAKTVEDLALFMRVVTSKEVLLVDPTVPNLQFNEEEYSSKKKMRIGYFFDDGFIAPCKTAIRAVHEAIDILKSNGHELIEFKPKSLRFKDASIKHLQLMVADQGVLADQGKDGEPDVYYSKFKLHTKSKLELRAFKLMLNLIGQKRIAELARPELTGVELMEESVFSLQFKEKFIDEMKELNLDALVCPTMPIPAPVSALESRTTLFTITYCALFSYLCFPSGSVPVTRVRSDEEEYTSSIRDLITKDINANMKGSAGMPLAVQIVSYPFREERVLNLMKQVEEKSGFKLEEIDQYSSCI